MPPKKDAAGAEARELLAGFTDKETKFLAAAFLSSLGPDKFDFELMATLTGHTLGTTKKLWPPVKRKAIEKHPSSANLLGSSSRSAPLASEASQSAPTPRGKKRKTAEEVDEEIDESEAQESESDKKAPKKKSKKPAARPKKQLKTEDADSEEHTEEHVSDNGEEPHSEDDEFV